ncbi:MAG: hypothetical protein TRG1_1988 [Flavobacteriaceae bacterium FS1-H7996/R]|nr:MAG: hypothetical protein TRG1_1988 [Flavobacteriaceae bacterium FS1-H7996/R]
MGNLERKVDFLVKNSLILLGYEAYLVKNKFLNPHKNF